MSLYIQNKNTGELWLRNAIGKIESASDVLSAIYLKYSEIDGTSTFYEELKNNQITRFDVFYDCIFVETKSGCFFEKIDVNENRSLVPYTKTYFYNPKQTTQVDYWLNEYQHEIYFTDINLVSIFQNTFIFDVSLKVFDCDTGLTTLKMNERVELYFSTSTTWFDFIPVIENPKLTYNPDTKNYNISFVFRSRTGDFALLSLMIKLEDEFKIFKIDGIVPFATLDKNLSKHYSLIGTNFNVASFSLASFSVVEP